MNVKQTNSHVGPGGESSLASQTWTAIQEYFFAHGRPRMLALWREFDLAPPQMMALSLLAEPKPMGELASLLHCDNSNITWIVDKLSERGFVERLASPGDRRVKLVALTPEGTKLRDELARRRAVPPPEMEALTQAELRSLGKIIGKLSGPPPTTDRS
jgi:DNA-binding MarR family transcriptional regulator